MTYSNFKIDQLRIQLIIGIYSSTKDSIKTCQDAATLWDWVSTGKDPIIDESN